MAIHLIMVTHKLPAWLQTGYQDYAKRLSPPFNLKLTEIPAEKRSASNLSQVLNKETDKVLSYIKPHHKVIALDSRGKLWTTEEFTIQLDHWLQGGQPIDLIIGGPEGLTPRLLDRADVCWSLSLLTFPHHLVRLLIAEQIFRAASILKNHPYHR